WRGETVTSLGPVPGVSMVLNAFRRALSPCFVFRPDVFIRAFWRKVRPRPERCVVKTAWGDRIAVEPHKFIGASLYMRGVHELPVCEVLWRLASPGEAAVDVGANIGVMTSLLSRRVGAQGRVFAFEAHPEVFQQLELNVRRWNRPWTEAHNRAVSCRSARLIIYEGDGFGLNEGTARMVNSREHSRSFEVPSVRLDEVLTRDNCGVIKIDVEGHEAQVLSGAKRYL